MLSRDPVRARGVFPSPHELYAWSPLAGPPPSMALNGVDAVVHLAGESVGQHRWSAREKNEILKSRVLSTRNLVQAIVERREARPLTFISASAIGYYGDRGDEWLNENSKPGTGFLSEVCRAWEAEVQKAAVPGVRVFIPRFGMVLGKDGGALERMIPLFKRGWGGPVGSGHQWMSWIHRDDLVSILEQGLLNSSWSGVLNAVAPGVVQNRVFSEKLAQALGVRAWLHTPSLALKLGLGEMACLALDSQRVSNQKLLDLGFQFSFPDLQAALKSFGWSV